MQYLSERNLCIDDCLCHELIIAGFAQAGQLDARANVLQESHLISVQLDER